VWKYALRRVTPGWKAIFIKAKNTNVIKVDAISRLMWSVIISLTIGSYSLRITLGTSLFNEVNVINNIFYQRDHIGANADNFLWLTNEVNWLMLKGLTKIQLFCQMLD